MREQNLKIKVTLTPNQYELEYTEKNIQSEKQVDSNTRKYLTGLSAYISWVPPLINLFIWINGG